MIKESYLIYSEKTGETPIIKGSQAYFTCPSCKAPQNKQKFSFNIYENKYHCWKNCNYKEAVRNILYDSNYYENKKTDIDYNRVLNKSDNNINAAYDNNKKKIAYSNLTDNEKSKINNLLLDLYNFLDVSNNHKELFLNKRDFKLFDNARSSEKLKEFIQNCFNNKLSPLYGKHDKKTFEILRLTKGSGLEYQNKNVLMYFFRGLNNEFTYYQVYDIEKITFFRKEKRLQIKNYLTQAYNLYEVVNNQYDKEFYFITESVEKIECLKDLGYQGIGLLGIYHGIQALKDMVHALEGKKFIITFDTKKSIYSPSIIEAIKLCYFLNKNNIECYISFLDLPLNSDIEDLDIDDYLKGKPYKTKINEVEKLIKNKKTTQDILDFWNIELINDNDVFSKRNKKTIQKRIKKTDFVTIDNVREDLPNILKNCISDYENFYTKDKIQYALIKAPAGSGKTTAFIELVKHRVNILNSQKILYITSNKNLINEVLEKANNEGIKVRHLKSINDVCTDNHKEELNKPENEPYKKDLIRIENNKEIYINPEKINKLMSNDYDYKSVCQACKIWKTCKLNEVVQPDYSEYKENLFTVTLEKLIRSKNILEKIRPNIIVIDEEFSSKLTKNKEINNKTLENLKKLIDKDNKYQLMVFQFIKALLKDLKKTEIINRNNENYIDFSVKIDRSNLGIFDFDTLLNKYTGLKSFLKGIDIKELELKEEAVNNENIDNLEHKNILVDFINAIKNKNCYTNNKNIIFGIKKELKLPSLTPIIFLDATGSQVLIKKYLNLENDKDLSVYEPKLKHDNLNIFQNIDYTFSKSCLKPKDKEPKLLNQVINFINNTISNNDKVLIIANKWLISEFKNCFSSNVSFLNFGNLRGLNEFSEYNKMFMFNNSINFHAIELNAKLNYKINDFEKEKIFVDTNIINKSQMVQIENIKYKDKILNEMLKQEREAELYQAIKRIYRDYKTTVKKEVFYFSDVVLSDFIHEKINTFTLEKTPYTQDKIILARKDIKRNIENCLEKMSCYSTAFYIDNGVKKLENLKKDVNFLTNNIYNRTFTLATVFTEFQANRLNISTKKYKELVSDILYQLDLKEFNLNLENKNYKLFAKSKNDYDNFINRLNNKEAPIIDEPNIKTPENLIINKLDPLYNDFNDYIKLIHEIKEKLSKKEVNLYTNDKVYKITKDYNILPIENFYIKYPDKKQLIHNILNELKKNNLIDTKIQIEGLKQALDYLTCNYYFKENKKELANLFYVLDRELTYIDINIPINNIYSELKELAKIKPSPMELFNIIDFIKEYQFTDNDNNISYFETLQAWKISNKDDFLEKYNLNLNFANRQAEIINNSDLFLFEVLEKLELIIDNTYNFELATTLFYIYMRLTEFRKVENKIKEAPIIEKTNILLDPRKESKK